MKAISRISIFIVFCLMLVNTIAPAFAQPAPTSLGDKVDAYVSQVMHRFPIPGLAVGIVTGDQILYLKGYGTANTNGDAVTPQTLFLMGSVTKTFTALAVHQLAESGKLALKEPLRTYIPEFRLADEASAASITVRQLLDHETGITTVEGTEPYLYSLEASFQEALHGLAHFRPKYKPGEHYEYSNWNYVLLGEVITRVSGEPYRDYVQHNILDPLEMSHSSFNDYHTLSGAASGNLILFGFPVPYHEELLPVMTSAGYLNSSAEDMTHYLTLYFNKGEYQGHGVLPVQGSGWYDDSWNWHIGTPDDISYGFSGGHNSFNTNIQLFPFHKVGVVVLMNTRLDELIPGAIVNDIAYNIARITIDLPYQLPSARSFYTGFALIDAFFLLMPVSIFWQVFKLRQWGNQYKAGNHAKRLFAWLGICLDILIGILALAFPNLLNTRWNIALHIRPDFAIPLLIIGLALLILGVTKILKTRL